MGWGVEKGGRREGGGGVGGVCQCIPRAPVAQMLQVSYTDFAKSFAVFRLRISNRFSASPVEPEYGLISVSLLLAEKRQEFFAEKRLRIRNRKTASIFMDLYMWLAEKRLRIRNRKTANVVAHRRRPPAP